MHLSSTPGHMFAYVLALAGVFVSGLYSFRLVFFAFHGKERFDVHGHDHAHHDAHHAADEEPGHEEILDPASRNKAIPFVVRSTAHYRPELGESITTALQQNYDRMAVQIVAVMEEGW